MAAQQGFPAQYQAIVDGERRATQPWLFFFQTLWNRTGAALAAPGFSSGFLADFAGPAANVPQGWLLCDGSAVSRITYAALFAAVGTTWGIGDGSTTFNLPNFINVFAAGGTVAGQKGGTSAATLTAQNLPIVAASNVTAGAAAGGVTAQTPVSFSILPPFATVLRIIKT